MTEQTPAALPEVPITFRDREIWVRPPTPEQLVVWRRILKRLQGMGQGTDWTAESVLAEAERSRMIVDSMLVNKADVIWMDDGFLDGSLTFQDLMPFPTLVMEAFAEAAKAEGNREERRAAKKAPAKKATRKKAA